MSLDRKVNLKMHWEAAEQLEWFETPALYDKGLSEHDLWILLGLNFCSIIYQIYKFMQVIS